MNTGLPHSDERSVLSPSGEIYLEAGAGSEFWENPVGWCGGVNPVVFMVKSDVPSRSDCELAG